MQITLKNQTQALWGLAAAAVLWSTGGLAIKLIAWNPLAIAGTRSGIAAVMLLLLVKGNLKFNWSKSQIFCALAYAVTVICFVMSTKMTTAANSILLQYTAPVYVALLAPILLGEPTRRLDWIFIILSLGGLFLFFLDQLTPSGFWGNILAIISGISFATLTVLLRKQREADPLDSVVLGNIIAAVVCLPFVQTPLPGLGDMLILLAAGVFQLGFAYILFTEGAKQVKAIEVILISMLEPIFNPLLVLIFYGEIPGFWATVGGVVVLSLLLGRALLTLRSTG